MSEIYIEKAAEGHLSFIGSDVHITDDVYGLITNNIQVQNTLTFVEGSSGIVNLENLTLANQIQAASASIGEIPEGGDFLGATINNTGVTSTVPISAPTLNTDTINPNTENGTVTISGNLKVTGTTTTVNTTNLEVQDAIVSFGTSDDGGVLTGLDSAVMFSRKTVVEDVVQPNSNVAMVYKDSGTDANTIVFGYTNDSATDLNLTIADDIPLDARVTGSITAKSNVTTNNVNTNRIYFT